MFLKQLNVKKKKFSYMSHLFYTCFDINNYIKKNTFLLDALIILCMSVTGSLTVSL